MEKEFNLGVIIDSAGDLYHLTCNDDSLHKDLLLKYMNKNGINYLSYFNLMRKLKRFVDTLEYNNYITYKVVEAGNVVVKNTNLEDNLSFIFADSHITDAQKNSLYYFSANQNNTILYDYSNLNNAFNNKEYDVTLSELLRSDERGR